MSQVRRPPVRAACFDGRVPQGRDHLYPTLASRYPRPPNPAGVVADGDSSRRQGHTLGARCLRTKPHNRTDPERVAPFGPSSGREALKGARHRGFHHWLLMLLPSGEHGTVKLRYASFGFPGFPSGLSQSPEGVRLQRLLEIC